MITALFQYAPKALVLWVAWPCFVFVGWFALIKLRHWELTIFWAALTLGGAMWVVGKIPLAVEDVIGIGRGIVIRVGTEDEPRGTAFWLERGAVAATCADAFPGGKVGDGVVGYESRPVSIGGVLGGRGFASLQGDGLLQIVFINSQIAILKIVPGRETILAGTEWSFGAKRMKLSEATLDMYDVPAGSDVVLVGHDDNTDPSQFSSREGRLAASAVELDKVNGMPRLRIPTTVPYRKGFCGSPMLNKFGKVIGMALEADNSGDTRMLPAIEIDSAWSIAKNVGK